MELNRIEKNDNIANNVAHQLFSFCSAKACCRVLIFSIKTPYAFWNSPLESSSLLIVFVGEWMVGCKVTILDRCHPTCSPFKPQYPDLNSPNLSWTKCMNSVRRTDSLINFNLNKRSPVNFSMPYHTQLTINWNEKFAFDRLLRVKDTYSYNGDNGLYFFNNIHGLCKSVVAN